MLKEKEEDDNADNLDPGLSSINDITNGRS